MPRIRLDISDDLLQQATASSERLWPGQGRRGVLRLVRDAIRRYVRYCDGDTGNRSKR
jgi:hypothetical protein